MFYIFLFLALLGTGVGLFPVPEEIIVLSAGVALEQEIGNVFITLLVLAVGLFLSDFIIYWLGKNYGARILRIKFFSFFLPQEKVEKVCNILNGHSKKIIFVGRFVSGFRTISFFAAGMAGIAKREFIITDFIASLLYLPFFVFIGYRFSYDISILSKDLTKIYHLIELFIILSIIIWFGLKFSKRAVYALTKNGK